MLHTISPWHKSIFQQWQQFIAEKKIPQALLLHGAPGLAKAELVRAMLAYLWCLAPNAGSACGTCRHCHWWAQEGGHSDCFWLKPEAPGKAIKIDMLREACAWLQLSPLNTEQKVLVVESAHQLNTAASNALLKTLEEPQDSSLIILITEMPERLLPTLRSRCYQLSLSIPDETFLRSWLAEQTDVPPPAVLPAGLGPYALLAECSTEQAQMRHALSSMFEAVHAKKMYYLTAAEKLKTFLPQEVLRYLYFFMQQHIKDCCQENDLASLQRWLKFEQHWLEVKRAVLQGANLNWPLQLELLLADIA